MECLGCELTNVVTLSDGKTVCNTCPAYRLECEAKNVLSKPLEQRKAYSREEPPEVNKYTGKPLAHDNSQGGRLNGRVNTWIGKAPNTK